VLNLINNSLVNCAGTNSSNFTMILSFIAQNRIHFKTRKKRVFPGSFSQLPETRIFLFCSELETLVKTVRKVLLLVKSITRSAGNHVANILGLGTA